MPTFLRTLDSKLVATVVAGALTALVVKLGFDPEDPTVVSAVSLAVGAVVGYLTPNDGTVLRTPQESGSAVVPPEVRH